MPQNFMGSNVGFMGPDADKQMEIQRRQALAQALQQQGAEPLKTEMAGGWAVPIHPFQGLAKMAQTGAGVLQGNKAQELARALQQTQQQRRGADISLLVDKLRGRQASSGGLTEDVAGNITRADPMAAQTPSQGLQQALPMMQDPQMQQVGLSQLMSQIKREQAPPERVDLGDRIGLVQNGQIVGYLPKGATPDASLRETGANQRHAQPSGSAQLGAQTTLQTHATPSGSALLTDARSRSEGALGRGQALQIAQMGDARARETAGAGRVPPGYRTTASGGLEAIPGGPADEKEEKKTAEVSKAVDMYVAARDGLLGGLEGTQTGPLSGRIPAVTTGQQVAEGGVAAMAPVLKQLFRVSGEGVFTDRDQALLLDMVPKRTDHAAARAEKMANIDRIVSAKLGQQVPSRAGYNGPERRAGGDDPLGLRKK